MPIFSNGIGLSLFAFVKNKMCEKVYLYKVPRAGPN